MTVVLKCVDPKARHPHVIQRSWSHFRGTANRALCGRVIYSDRAIQLPSDTPITCPLCALRAERRAT